MKIGVQFGNPETTGGGGNSLKFYASCRIRTSTRKRIDNTRLKIPIGVNLKVSNVKNKCFRPHMQVEGLQLLYEAGVNPLSGVRDCLEKAERIEMVKAGYWKVREPWACGQEVVFRAAKSRGEEIPIDDLLRCPKVVDAESSEQLADYLAPYLSAIKQIEQPDVNESDVEEQMAEEYA